jgi:hypothetical protein
VATIKSPNQGAPSKPIRTFCERLKANGKNGKAIVCAAMRLIHLAFAILKSGLPFDPNYAVVYCLPFFQQDGIYTAYKTQKLFCANSGAGYVTRPECLNFDTMSQHTKNIATG